MVSKGQRPGLLSPAKAFRPSQKKEAKSSKLFSIWSNLQKKTPKHCPPTFHLGEVIVISYIFLRMGPK